MFLNEMFFFTRVAPVRWCWWVGWFALAPEKADTTSEAGGDQLR